ncbi:TonB-dependent receptor domain-containing protein [Oxalicibacterium flavum]|uniref:TonB-dependent receptor domain-containing protein n=1 Tax=Oxalicibacterium flavum TaxID=179467 RepID=UPI0035315F1F
MVGQGADFSLNGELAPGWNAAAGYTYVGSEYASGVDKGARYMTYMPRHSVRLAANYRRPGSDWSVGGNLRFQSGITVPAPATVWNRGATQWWV